MRRLGALCFAILMAMGGGACTARTDCADNDVCQANGLLSYLFRIVRVFVATAGTDIYYSFDGYDWKKAASTGTAQNLQNVTYGGGIFVAVGNGGAIVYSRNLANWTAATSPSANTLRGIVHARGYFVVTGNSGDVLISSDGVNWTLHTVGAAVNLQPVAFGNGLFVVNQAGASTVYYSASAQSGTWQSFSLGSIAFGYAVAAGPDRFVFADGGNTIEVWNSTLTASLGSSGTATVSSNGLVHRLDDFFYAPGTNHVIDRSASGTDGVWTSIASGCASNSGNMAGLAFGNGVFIGGGTDSGASRVLCRSSSFTSGSFVNITPEVLNPGFTSVHYLTTDPLIF
ncbi:MAG: hypothetical protein H7A21_03820 [Spirochaetales bacterium]|nr:hypothetical protein [Spirochaetales bacterium]MCP5483889.1 hypothetical protein [Spirochaetales bacterium]